MNLIPLISTNSLNDVFFVLALYISNITAICFRAIFNIWIVKVIIYDKIELKSMRYNLLIFRCILITLVKNGTQKSYLFLSISKYHWKIKGEIHKFYQYITLP